MPHQPFVILEAPSVLGLFPNGVERLPEALLRAGLMEHLGASHGGRVEPPPYEPRRDPASGLLNPAAIAQYSVELADAVSGVLDGGGFPVVLGGDCSIILGNLLALKRRGRFGLLFIDGHADFYQPEAEPNGEAASMDLALATGRGPECVTRLEGKTPLAFDEDVVVLGRRDREDADAHGSQRVEDTAIEVIDLAALRAVGAERAAERSIDHLSRRPIDGYWIHLDADVLDDAVMPAVDYRMPDGLRWNELTSILAIAARSGKAVGIDVTIFNPRLDADGSIAATFAEVLARGLRVRVTD